MIPRRLLLTLCCLVPAGLTLTHDADAAPKKYPTGEAVYRDCFTYEEEDALQGIGYLQGVGGAAAGAKGAGGGNFGTIGLGSSGAGRGGGGLGTKKRKMPSKPKPSPMAPPSMTMPAPPPPPPPAEPEPVPDVVDARPADNPGTPGLDFGAKMFLSNDDSMSLASAQRLIWAVQNSARWTAAQVRPHELLNYFSFDTVTPDAEQVFDVQVSAARTDADQLSMALAVKGATPEPMPLDLTTIVDVSCSMSGEGRMDYTKKAMRQMHDQLKDGDRFDLVVFDDQVCVPLENYVVGRDDRELFEKAIRQMEPRGSTDMDLGLREGYRVAKAKKEIRGRNRRVMVMTDALLNTGDVNTNTVSEIGKAFDSDDIRLTGVGVGRDFNDKVLDMLTEKGKGAYVYLGSEAVVERLFGVGFPSLVNTIAHDVQFELQLPDSLAIERFYGEEASTNAADIQPINYYAGTSQVFLQDLALKDGKVLPDDPVVLTIRYRHAETGEPEERVFNTTVGTMMESNGHNLHKARALMAWTDLLTEKALGGDACAEPLSIYKERASRLSEDLEVDFVSTLVEKTCNVKLADVTGQTGTKVAYKVKVDSDIPIAEVALACGNNRANKKLSAGTSVAKFDARPGSCTLELTGNVAMKTRVDVPETGGDVRCIVRGGRMSCS